MFGALLYLFGGITLGNLSSFVLYSRKFSGPINEIANIFSELQSAMAAAERIFRLIDEEPEPADAPGAEELTEAEGRVDFSHVRFGYLPEKTIIHDLSLHADPGSLIAIVGPTGAGKTTLINLLMRFYDPDSGAITLDGRDIKAVTRKSLRLSFAMVLQDTWLFQGTVFDNIAYGKADAGMDEVVAAAKAAKIHSYISHLPEGYDTVLDENGLNISQGQKQLLTIARAMRSLMEHKTCFVIAHRLSTIQNADLILVVRDGEIVEQGRHEELLQREGVYAGMYRSQFE